jgi:hypothetical protein
VWAAAENSAAGKRGNDTAECSAVISDLENDGKTYYVWIKAKNAGGTSAPSEAVGATMRVDTAHLDAYLRALAANTPETPHTVRLAASASTIINTEDTSELALGVWASIDSAVRDAQRYVTLDLGACYASQYAVSGASNPTANKMNIVKDNVYVKGIVLPQNLKSIGSYTFFGCTGLSEVTIPGSVTKIDNYAFDGCTNLTIVTFAAGSAINSSNFSYTSSFPGDLRDQYFSESGGGAGTYRREAGASTWTNMAAPPTGVTAAAQTVSSIRVSWDTVSWAESYKIYRASASTGGAYSIIHTTQNDSYVDTGLSVNTTYYYKVSIVSAAGEGRLSSYGSAATRIPAVPANLNAMALSSHSIVLSWNAVSEADSYKVYRAESAEDTYNSIGTSQTASYTDDSDLSVDTTYYYKVSALNGDLESSQPEYVSAKTLLYSTGDTGPAGGLICYADATGFVFDGVTYHYLEAAPADLSGTYQWGGYGTFCSTETAIGTGAANTAALTASDHGHTHPAAQACAEYEYDSYDDWFLPSKDELNQMYTNLKKLGLGGFVNDYYWSSSEISDTTWVQSFGNGTQYSGYKGSAYRVRAARMF